MSIKKKVFAVAATMTMVGGVSTVGLMSAQASTPSCSTCVTVIGDEFGPAFPLDVLRQGEKAGQALILFRASNSDPAEDFTYSDQGTVADFYAAKMVSAAVDLHYGGGAVGYPNDEAYELEYAPYGVDSNLCMGVGSTARDGTPVALEPCGASSKTVWIVDSVTVTVLADSIGSFSPVINGSDTNFSHPYVLHYPGNAYPTDLPRAQLTTHTLQEYSDGTVYNNELWSDGS